MCRWCVTRYILSTAVATTKHSQTGVSITAIQESALDQDETRERVRDADGADDYEFRHRSYRGKTEKAGTFAESAIDKQYRRGKGATVTIPYRALVYFYQKRNLFIIKKI